MAERAELILSAVDKTKVAFTSAKRNLQDLQGTATGIAARFGSVGLAIAAAFEGASLKGAIDAADQLSKLEQKTGIAVEQLSALKFAGQLSDVAVGDLLTTSGVDGVYPPGLPVARVEKVERQVDAVFARIGSPTTTLQIMTRAGSAQYNTSQVTTSGLTGGTFGPYTFSGGDGGALSFNLGG